MSEKIKLKLAKSMDGNLIIYDHPRVLFVVSPTKRKITLIAKENIKDDLFPVQKRFMHFVTEKGLIIPGSESIGYLPNMFELTYPNMEQKDSLKIILKFLHQFILKEKEIYSKIDSYKEETEKRLLEPDDDLSTELGEIPHGEKKGTMLRSPYYNFVSNWMGWWY